jgi:diguanylate cyclase (GGDEF)-like protein/PAS domain S-box-containing protein
MRTHTADFRVQDRPGGADTQKMSPFRTGVAPDAADAGDQDFAADQDLGPSALDVAARLYKVARAQRDIACAPAEIGELFQIVTDRYTTVLAANYAILFTFDGDQPLLGATAGDCTFTAVDLRPERGPYTQQALDTGEIVVCGDPGTALAIHPMWTELGTRSFVLVPLMADGRCIGLLHVGSRRANAFDSHHVALAELLRDVTAARIGDALARGSRDAAARQLAEVQRLHGTVLESLAEGILVLDTDGALQICNRAAERILGMSERHAIGRVMNSENWGVVRADGSPLPTEELPPFRALRTGLPQKNRVIGVHNRVDGELRWISASAVPLLEEGAAAPTGVVCSLTDVTDQLSADRALKASERNLLAAHRLAGLASWQVDLATGELRSSGEAYRFFGGSPEEYTPSLENFFDLVEPSERAHILAIHADLITGRTPAPARFSFHFVTADGETRVTQNWVDVERDAGGRVVRLHGTSQDITEIRQHAAALAETEQRFSLAFEAGATGVVLTSTDGERSHLIDRANAAFADMVGCAAEELTGRTLGQFTHPEDLARDSAVYASLLAGSDDTEQWETRLVGPDGRDVWTLVNAALARDAEGRPLYFITQFLDITARRQAQQDLEDLSLTDSLTGLANRPLLGDRVQQALARMRREPGTLALILLDLDRFKVVNDSLGHQVGDALLIAVAERLKGVSRPDTTVARVGGDEFVVLVEDLPEPEAVNAVAERILDVIRQPFRLGEATAEFVTTASVGIAVTDDADRDSDDLFREADLALYRAKEAGRDRLALYDEELRSRAVDRLDTERRLRSAIADSNLVAYYQPLVDLGTGRITGAEALVRMQDPELGLLGPPAFIDIAEDSGLIVDIDGWMLVEAARTALEWVTAKTGVESVAVNVSARTLAHRDFLDVLRKATGDLHVNGRLLHLEITERVVLSGEEAASGLLTRARELGPQLGIDDFGTGYSALSYLQRLALDFVKIDRSFVTPLGDNPQTGAIVGAIIDLAHALGLSVVAEGVETEQQLAILRELGCDVAQGFLIGKPMPKDEFEALVTADLRW